MPLLMCPHCSTEMKEVNRRGVEIDICPSCQGIWLDRGELNHLLEGAPKGIAENLAENDSEETKTDKSKWQYVCEVFDVFDVFDK